MTPILRRRCSTRTALAVLLALATGGPAVAEPEGITPDRVARPDGITPDQVAGPGTWGDVSNVMRLRHLYFSAQPDEAALEAARDAGVGVVVNLREVGEEGFSGADAERERAAAEALGLRYVAVPVPGPDPFSPEAFDRIESVVRDHEDAKVWLHCSSGNRAAGWLAVHLVRAHGMTVDDALAVGRRAGITKDAVEERVRALVDQTPDAEGGAGSE